MKRIHNTNTNKTIWRGDDYLVDGQQATVNPPLYILLDVEKEKPDYDALTHKIVSVPAYADLEAKEWVIRSWEVVPLTEEEIAENAIVAARKTWPDASSFFSEFSLTPENPEMALIALSQDPTIAALRLLLAAWNKDVWSDDPRIVAGVNQLVTLGILTEDRKQEILSK